MIIQAHVFPVCFIKIHFNIIPKYVYVLQVGYFLANTLYVFLLTLKRDTSPPISPFYP
jgi:hypothetical protein